MLRLSIQMNQDQDGRTTTSPTELGKTFPGLEYIGGFNNNKNITTQFYIMYIFRKYSHKHSEEAINKVIQQAFEGGLKKLNFNYI